MTTIRLETRLIAVAGTISQSFDVGNAVEGSFSTPAAITGTTIQPQFSNDNVNFTSVGSAISVTANNTYALPDGLFLAKFARLVSNSAEAAERTITLGLRR